MADGPPPGRYSIVERGGRLVVIDRDTGRTPPTAAERMAEHDRRMGHEPVRPEPRQAPGPTPPANAPESQPPARPANERIAAAADRNRKQPWKDQPRPAAKPARAAPPPRPEATGNQRATIVTGKWWDAKGPRTIELGPKGKQVLANGFVTLLIAAIVAVAVLLFILPVALFVAAFLLFRWGGSLLGPLGASIIDKALAEKG